MDLTGKANIGTAVGIFATPEAHRQITQSSTPDVSVGSVISAVLALAVSAVSILISPFKRGITVGNPESLVPAANRLALTPIDGQSGRSLEWNESLSTGTVPAELKTAIDAVVKPVRPKKTVESLVAALANALPAAYQDRVNISVNQATAEVGIELYANNAAREAAESSYVDNVEGEDSMTMTLKNDVAVEGPAPLMFEGGTISLP